MNYDLREWLSLVVRWVHAVSAIFWIGATLYLGRLGRQMAASGDVFTIHSGHFVLHQAYPSIPAKALDTLRWFKYESLTTWISGALLLVMTYYMGSTLTFPESRATETAALAIAIGTVAGGVAAYRIFWRYIAPGQHEVLGATVGYAWVVGVAYLLCAYLNGRAAYIHVGVLFGTIMVSNVWFTIMPAQRAMVAAIRDGLPPNQELGDRAARCTRHNTHLMVPTVLVMVSNHYPTITYGSDHPAFVLSVIIIVGWGGGWLLRHKL